MPWFPEASGTLSNTAGPINAMGFYVIATGIMIFTMTKNHVLLMDASTQKFRSYQTEP